jgi:hypothetical protein
MDEVWCRGFRFEIVQECEEEDVQEVEQTYLNNQRENLYNIRYVASGGDLISNHPEHDRIVENMRQSLKKRFADMGSEQRKRTYGRPGTTNPVYGRTHTEEARKRISMLNKLVRGKDHPNYGIKRSLKTRRKMSVIASQRLGERNPFYGRTHSQETKRRLAEQNRGKIPTDTRTILANDVEYVSVRAAARALGVSPAWIIYRIKSSKPEYDGYCYKEQDNA